MCFCRFHVTLLVLVSAVLTGGVPCLSRTWRVPSDVSSIPAAAESSSYGDTVLVAPGEYTCPDDIASAPSWLSLPSGVSLIGKGGADSTTILDSSATYWPHGVILISGGTGCLVKGFTFLRSIGVGGYFYGVYIDGASNTFIDSCRFVDFYTGVLVEGDVGGPMTPSIRFCQFSECWIGIECVTVTPFDSPVIRFNTFINNGWGIACRDAGPYLADNEISFNDHAGITCEGRSPAWLDRNVITNNGTYGLYVNTDPYYEPYMTTDWLPQNGNSIFGNGVCDLLNAVTDQGGDIEATCTYWGSECPDFNTVVQGPGRVNYTPWADSGHTKEFTPNDCPGAVHPSTWGSIKALFR